MATEVSTPPTAAAPPTTAAAAPPLFEYFCSVPHPAASKSCPPLVVLPAPHQVNTGQPHPKVLNQLSAFCFPEYDEALLQPAGRQAVAAGQTTALFQHMVVNRYDQYAMQPKSFSSFTFTLQLQDGRRWYGHVRRSLPLHPKAAMRYDVGRRGERALVLLTQSAGAGQLYQAMLKYVITGRCGCCFIRLLFCCVCLGLVISLSGPCHCLFCFVVRFALVYPGHLTFSE